MSTRLDVLKSTYLPNVQIYPPTHLTRNTKPTPIQEYIDPLTGTRVQRGFEPSAIGSLAGIGGQCVVRKPDGININTTDERLLSYC